MRPTLSSHAGAYLRVVEPGQIRAGDPVDIVDRPRNGVTVALAFRAFTSEAHLLPALLPADGVGDSLREEAAKAVASLR